MSRAARFFQALKLVEADDSGNSTPISDPAIESLPQETVESAPLPPIAADAELGFPEGVALDTIYAEAGVPAATFSIEKLGKLFDGLNQLDPETKKTAVRAMDAADDSWTIDEVLIDAGNKIGAIDAYIAKLSQLEQGITSEAGRRIDGNQTAKKASVEDIDAQIAALEKQREAAIAASATEVARLRSQGLAATDAADRERRRLSDTVRAYQGLVGLFNQTAPAANPDA